MLGTFPNVTGGLWPENRELSAKDSSKKVTKNKKYSKELLN